MAKLGTKLQKLCYYVVKKERSKIIKQIKNTQNYGRSYGRKALCFK